MAYRISEKAVEDLENIWVYTFQNWSLQQADKYFNLLLNEIEYISENPYKGKDYSHIRLGYFKAQFKRHFIFYKIDKNGGIVEIIRVLHQQMDVEENLNERP